LKTALLLCLVLIAFAANSLLSRAGLADGQTGPASFAVVRLISGAVMLGLLVTLRAQSWPTISARHVKSAIMLLIYVIGFSYAYLTLETGAGALILFGGVQITMFAVSAARRDAIGPLSWLGAALAFAGLCYLLWPGTASTPDVLGSGLMLLAALGWGFFTLNGQGARDPLASMALAFVLCAPVMVLVWLVWPDTMSRLGLICAILSGAVTSGLGYALWYHVLPGLTAATAAVAQLTVPVIAAAAGALILAEPLTSRFALATLMVLGGVALTVFAQRKAG